MLSKPIRKPKTPRPGRILRTSRSKPTDEAARSVRLVQGQCRVLEMIAAGAPLGETLAALVGVIETDIDGTRGSILLLDESGGCLRHMVAPSLPEALRRLIDGFKIGPAAASCGTAAYRGEAVIVEDTETDPLWTPYREVARANGLRACWSTPIFDRQRAVLGTFAIYLRTPARPAQRHQRTIEMATHTAAIAITRNREIRALQDSERSIRSILEGMMIGFVTLDHSWRFTYVNPKAAEILGRKTASLVGRKYLEAFPEAESSPLELTYRKVMSERVTMHTEHYFSAWNRWLEQRVDPTPDGGISIFFQDTTERRLQLQKIEHLARVYAVLSGINALMVREHNRESLLRDACRIAVEQGGFRMAWIGIIEPAGTKIIPVASAGMEEQHLAALKEFFSSGTGAVSENTLAAQAIKGKKAVVSNNVQNDPKILLARKYTGLGVRSLAVLPLIVADKAIGVLTLYADQIEFFEEEGLRLLTELAGDISFAIDHIAKQAQLDYLAYYDVLTGLANRSLFLERVAQYLRGAASGGYKVAVGLIDLERFKNINDSLGRAAGDAFLKQVGEWLTRSLGDANLAARLGTDHFAVVMPIVEDEESVIALLGKRIEPLLNQPVQLSEGVVRISFKCGIALYPDNGADAETLLRNSEIALRKAKVTGDRYLLYTKAMTASATDKLTLENQLRRAIENEEFVLHYQPKINLESGKLIGAEALIRWNDPITGLVPPNRFISVLEETGLIYEVGRWALHKAIEDYLRWHTANLSAVRIAVNVSPLQLRHRDFVDEIGRVVSINGLAAAGLELEITESLIMEDVKHSIVSLRAIRAMGVTIAIDDFGTGFSSLNYLSRLPVDTLKIDRSFVNDMAVSQEGLALVSTIVTLAHALKLKVVAEGVETEEQLRLLRSLNCNEMQGFLFSRPLPCESFERRYLAPSNHP
ncbi:MAG TPA: EAL domain-containing protein [Nitrosospira sp.]|nr:EAL domain-containing protein [Nitrosospira sp.]